MSHEGSRDARLLSETRNTARYFCEQPGVAWALLVGTLLWGVFAYQRMPKAKDPAVPPRVAVVTCAWPGARAEKVEKLVARRIEALVAENSAVEKVESVSRAGVAVVHVTLGEQVADRGKEFDDIRGRLEGLTGLPAGAGPLRFIKDFGDTAALLLTVASPPVDDIALRLRARAVGAAITSARARAQPGTKRATYLLNFPPGVNVRPLHRVLAAGARKFAADHPAAQGRAATVADVQEICGPGFLGIDLATSLDDAAILAWAADYARTRLQLSELHPDLWPAIVVRDPATLPAALRAVAPERYTYRELDDFSDRLQRSLQTVPAVAKVSRTGVVPEVIYLEYSQERLAEYGVQPSNIEQALQARNITVPGGVVETPSKNITIDPSGELHHEAELGDVLVSVGTGHAPAYLRDLVEISRGYESPPHFLNEVLMRTDDGAMHRSRAVTLSVQMRPGEQIAAFGAAVDAKIAEVGRLLPQDLILRRTSDQPQQVRENVSLFMSSLYEAIALVVLVALVGFWEWRSALLLSLSIPITLAMTFGLMLLCGLDVQQISIASLILALGLLVDDPVVAGDAIRRALEAGHTPTVAGWLGPTKLARAILFATVTNIAAYLPLLTLQGDVGRFIYSLPVVLTCSLVASRLVSMSFIPHLGRVLLRPRSRPAVDPLLRRSRGAAGAYVRVIGWAIDHYRLALVVAVALLVAGSTRATHLKTAFFPTDDSYLAYVDVWLPEDAPLAMTRQVVQQAEDVLADAAAAWGREHPDADGRPRAVLRAVTSFIGGGAPRFWFSVFPEISQLNYAQLLIEISDKHLMPELIAPLQAALSRRVAGARLDLRQLENGKPVGIPIQVRLSGESEAELRRLADAVKDIFGRTELAERVRDDWGAQTFSVGLQVDPDRASVAGVTNLDVGTSSALAMNGAQVTALRDGHRQIPVVSRLRGEERAQVGDIQNLYVSSRQTGLKVPLGQVSEVTYRLETEKLRRRNQFRTVTVAAFPVAGALPSEVLAAVAPAVRALAEQAPVGYEVSLGGEYEEQQRGFGQLAVVLGLSVVAIYFALLMQFRDPGKPLMVFAAIPFGVVGALVSLDIMAAPFGFMAFLGIVSLIGVIVSHIIVLFDFIEERRADGEPLREALIDAGLTRLRPVLITVGATVLGLIPLALHGGPLWQPLCYAQIGGLTVATFVTLLLVPVIYAATAGGGGHSKSPKPVR